MSLDRIRWFVSHMVQIITNKLVQLRKLKPLLLVTWTAWPVGVPSHPLLIQGRIDSKAISESE